MNPNSLLERVKQGESLSEVELREVRDALADSTNKHDKYTLIHIAWKARDAKSQDLIWTSANDDDEMVRRIALQALADINPGDAVFDLALRLSQDSSRQVRMVAARVIGTLGATVPSRTSEAARYLLEHLARHQSTQDMDWESYYIGLLELVQVPLDKRPLATRDLQIQDVNPTVIAAAKSLATQH